MEEGGKTIKVLSNFFVFFGKTRIKTKKTAIYPLLNSVELTEDM